MTQDTERELLRNFFGSYFHEDWSSEAQSPEAVIAKYIKTVTSEQMRLLSSAILNYSDRFQSDGELENSLYRDLGSYYAPSGAGISAKAWLKEIAHRLQGAAADSA